MFERCKWFHKKFHDTEMRKVENNLYLYCNTCRGYVPPMAVGVCLKYKKRMKLTSFNKEICMVCVRKLFKDLRKV